MGKLLNTKRFSSLYMLLLGLLLIGLVAACGDDHDHDGHDHGATQDTTVEEDTVASDEGTDPTDEGEPELLTIAETAAGNPDFSTLVTAVTEAGLIETLSDEKTLFTVFAPTNAAFEALPDGALDDLLANKEALTGVLLYHAVPGKVMAEEVVGLTSATTANGADITIEVVDGKVVLNGTVNVTATDIACSNGVIHVIDAVLLPPAAEVSFCDKYAEVCGDWPVESVTCADWWAAADEGTEGDTTGATQACYAYHLGVAESLGPDAGAADHCAHALGQADSSSNAPCTPNLAEVASKGGFTTLVAALDAAGLADTIANEGPFTVFAPTDEAFAAFIESSDTFASAEDLLGFDGLADVLLYHVVDGLVPASTVVSLTEAQTKQGGPVTIDATDGVVLNGSVNVITTDVYGSNGIIHVIDGVLLPPQ